MKIINTLVLCSIVVGLVCVYTPLRYLPLLFIFPVASLFLFRDFRITLSRTRFYLYGAGFLILLAGLLFREEYSGLKYVAGMLWSIALYEKVTRLTYSPRLLTVFSLVLLISLFLYPRYEFERFTSYLYNPNSVGSVAAAAVFLTNMFSPGLLLNAVAAVLAIGLYMLCKSRLLLLFLLLFPVCSWLFAHKKGYVVLLLVLVIVSIYMDVFIINIGEPVTFRTLTEFFTQRPVVSGRDLIDPNGRDVLARRAYEAAMDNFWGTGLVQTLEDDFMATHNMFLDMIYRAGWLYFLWYVVFLTYAVCESRIPAIKAVLVVINLTLLFDNGLPFMWSLWSAMAVLPYYIGKMISNSLPCAAKN